MKFLLILSIFLSSFTASASPEIGARVQIEYKQLRAMVAKWEPEYEVGGYMFGKKFGDHEVLWRLSDNGGSEVIRIYRDKGRARDAFAITFHYGDHLVSGHTVIRRFYGPAFTGWRNDTVDAETGEYLGAQGMATPAMDARDREILRKWGVKIQ